MAKRSRRGRALGVAGARHRRPPAGPKLRTSNGGHVGDLRAGASLGSAFHRLPQRRQPKGASNIQLLTPIFESMFDKVISLQLARAAWRLKRWPKTKLGALTSVALAASLPLFLNVLALATVPNYALRTWQAVAWLAALAFLDALAMLSAWYAFGLWVKAAPSLEDLISGCAGIEGTLRWYVKASSRSRQYFVSAIFAAGAGIFLSAVQPALKIKLEIGPISYISVAWTAAIGANMGYWIIVNPEFIRRLLRLKQLNLIWHSPASTLVIVKLSRGFAFTAIAMLGAALTTELLAFRISHYNKSAALYGMTIFVPVLAGLFTLVVGLMPHWWLYAVVRDARRASLEALQRLIGNRPPNSPRAADHEQGLVELYRLVEESPGLSFSTVAMVQYAAAVLGSLVAYFLARQKFL